MSYRFSFLLQRRKYDDLSPSPYFTERTHPYIRPFILSLRKFSTKFICSIFSYIFLKCLLILLYSFLLQLLPVTIPYLYN